MFAIAVPEWLQPIVNSLTNSLDGIRESAEQYLPKLVAMLVIVIVGYLVSILVRRIARTILQRLGIDVISNKLGLDEVLQSIGVKIPMSIVLAKLMFWSLLLIFVKAGIDVLELQAISDSFNSLLGYLPNLIAAGVVMLAGLMFAKFVRNMAIAAAERLGLDYEAAIGQLVYGVLVIIVGSVAVAQLQLKTDLVDRFLEIIFMAVGAALAIALGFGSRDTAKHVVAGVYARETFHTGAKVTIENEIGNVVAVQALNTKIEKEDGSLFFVPNGKLVESVVRQEKEA